MIFVSIVGVVLIVSERVRLGDSADARNAYNSTDCNGGLASWCESFEQANKCGVVERCKRSLTNLPSRRGWFYGFRKDSLKKTAKPVQLTVYFESLCPACKRMILDVIWPAYQTLARTKIVNMEFIPYGNGQELQYGGRSIISCQHGQPECFGNIIVACAIFMMRKQNLYVPFITCVEMYAPTEWIAQYCANLLHFNYYPISQCVNGPLGIELHHRMAMKTKALNPPHQVVPWLTLNGFHSNELQQGMTSNMIGFICGAYTGVKPAVCKKYLYRK